MTLLHARACAGGQAAPWLQVDTMNSGGRPLPATASSHPDTPPTRRKPCPANLKAHSTAGRGSRFNAAHHGLHAANAEDSLRPS